MQNISGVLNQNEKQSHQEEMENLEVDQEKWLPIKNYEGVYSISSFGNLRREIKGKRTFKGRIIRPSLPHSGYFCVKLTNNKQVKSVNIHKLVIETFKHKRPEGKHINHIDGNKLNNKIENLEYLTRKQNTIHAMKLGLIRKGEETTNSKLNNRDVLKIKNLISASNVKASKIAIMFNVSHQCIKDIKKERTWKHIIIKE